MSKTFFISDTHFGHSNVVRYDQNNDGRKFEDIHEHDNLLTENWNRVVTDNDTVYILGDFSWLNSSQTKELLEKLNGKKYLIKGNHDRWVKNYSCKNLLEGVYDYLITTIDGKCVVMSHYPILFYQSQHRNAIHLYGHVHNTREETIFQDACKNIEKKYEIPMNCYNVGCMISYMDYMPRTIEEILEKAREK